MTGARSDSFDESAERPIATSGVARSRYGTIVVVGGGCYGSYYVRQLGRASRAGALEWERLLVVDKDQRCAVALGEETDTIEDVYEPFLLKHELFFRRANREIRPLLVGNARKNRPRLRNRIDRTFVLRL